MSIKIYNGYKIPMMDLLDLHKFCLEFQELAKSHKTDLIYEILYHKLIFPRDFSYFEKEFPSFSHSIENYGDAFNELERRIWKDKDRADTLVDFSSEALFFPLKNNLICTFYGSQFTDKWSQFKGVEDFHYQDSTDRPDNIPKVEYDLRRDLWTEALAPSWVPSEKGFLFQFTNREINYLRVVGMKGFLNSQPPKSVRSKKLLDYLLRLTMMTQGVKGKSLSVFASENPNLVNSLFTAINERIPETYTKEEIPF